MIQSSGTLVPGVTHLSSAEAIQIIMKSGRGGTSERCVFLSPDVEGRSPEDSGLPTPP